VLGVARAQLVAQAALLALVVLFAVRARGDRAMATDPRRLAATAATILLGLQLTANYWTYAYLPWAFVCVALALLVDRPDARRNIAPGG
jgi:hypothetical protein